MGALSLVVEGGAECLMPSEAGGLPRVAVALREFTARAV